MVCAYRYSIEWQRDSDSGFDIDTVEGTIFTIDLLDRGSVTQHNITVVASKVSKYDEREVPFLSCPDNVAYAHLLRPVLC